MKYSDNEKNYTRDDEVRLSFYVDHMYIVHRNRIAETRYLWKSRTFATLSFTTTPLGYARGGLSCV